MMNAYLQLFLSLGIVILITGALKKDTYAQILEDSVEKNYPPVWAVLIAGSYGWTNYRHQSDICHAYQILRKHGIPEERIITMMFDDIAHHRSNPYPGKIFNQPHGKDVYEGVKIDYTKRDVNPKNFLAVISGNKSEIKGGNGRVVESNETDNIFVYFSDHGAEGMISFPDDDLITAKDLNLILMKMHENGKYRKLVFYLEACESGSMFNAILPKNISVYAVTAANERESSWASYCDNDMHLPCLGDEFSVNWMEDTEEEDITTETLKHQFQVVQLKTNESHVKHYGTLNIGSDYVGEFIGMKDPYPNTTKSNGGKAARHGIRWRSRDVTIMELYRRIKAALSDGHKKVLKSILFSVQKKRRYFESFMKKFVKSLVGDALMQKKVWTRNFRQITDFDCHDKVVKAFNSLCFNLARNPYTMEYVYILTNMCEMKIPTEKIIERMTLRCHEALRGIH